MKCNEARPVSFNNSPVIKICCYEMLALVYRLNFFYGVNSKRRSKNCYTSIVSFGTEISEKLHFCVSCTFKMFHLCFRIRLENCWAT